MWHLGLLKEMTVLIISLYTQRDHQFLCLPGPHDSFICLIIKQIFNEQLLSYKDILLDAVSETDNEDMCVINCKLRMK